MSERPRTKKKSQVQYCSQETALRSARRVLRVAFNCLANSRIRDVLLTDGRGLWTVGEILAHMEGVLALRVKR